MLRGRPSEGPMSEDSDLTLVSAIRGGELHRYAEVVERCDRAVRATLRRHARCELELEELVQETFYLGFRDLGDLADPARLRSWLCAIARRRAAERHRQRSRERVRREDREDDREEELQAQVADETWIWDEVALLPQAFRTILHLRYREGSSYREIAERLAVPPSTVRGRIHEARRALRERLRAEEERP